MQFPTAKVDVYAGTLNLVSIAQSALPPSARAGWQRLAECAAIRPNELPDRVGAAARGSHGPG